MWLYVAGILRAAALTPEIDASALVGYPAAEKYLGFDGHPTEFYLRIQTSRVTAVNNLLPFQASPEDPSEAAAAQPSAALTAQADAAGAFNGLFLGLSLCTGTGRDSDQGCGDAYLGNLARAWLCPFGRAFRLIGQRTYLADPRHHAAWDGGLRASALLYPCWLRSRSPGIAVTGYSGRIRWGRASECLPLRCAAVGGDAVRTDRRVPDWPCRWSWPAGGGRGCGALDASARIRMRRAFVCSVARS